eukprot:jgi/Orpsp1_1/1179142/evm.model.c7180000068101.1
MIPLKFQLLQILKNWIIQIKKNKKKYKQELKEHKSKEEKRIKKVVANVNLSSNSDEEIDDNKNSIDFKKEYNNENNRSMIPILSDDTISTSPNLIDNFKDNRNKNFEFSNESNSDWSNYNYSSSNITLKSNLNEEDAIKRNKELSKSLESLFDEEIKFNPPISKDKELKKKNKEKQLEKVLKDSKYIENDEGDNDSIHKHENNYSFSKNKFSKTKLKHVIDDDKHDNLENNKNKSKPNQNIKKEFEKEKEENIFKKKKLKKEKIIGKTEIGNPENKKVKQGKFDTIKLLYPNGKYESYPLIVPKKPDELNPIEDLKYTMQMVIRYCVPQKYQNLFGDSKNGIIRSIIKSTNRKNKEGLKKAIAEYNKVLESIINDKAFVDSEEYGDVSAPELVSHILIQAYSRTVAQKSDMLNSYRGFSNNVYGEVNSNLVTEFIKNSELKPHHIFIDMGSGIGNVVLQVASQVLCESWGVEIMEIPSTFAKAQCIEFISRMRYYGKPCGKIKLRHADFLEDPEVDRILKVADVVFVNNYAFDAKLNQRILQKFLDLKENTRIISLKSFVSLDHRINYRNANSLESILRVEEHLFGHDSVSWTNEEGKYYIHR